MNASWFSVTDAAIGTTLTINPAHVAVIRDGRSATAYVVMSCGLEYHIEECRSAVLHALTTSMTRVAQVTQVSQAVTPTPEARENMFDVIREFDGATSSLSQQQMAAALIEARDVLDALRKDAARLRLEHNSLLETARELASETYVPDANCACHVSAPCSDCAEYGHLRELLTDIRARKEERDAALAMQP